MCLSGKLFLKRIPILKISRIVDNFILYDIISYYLYAVVQYLLHYFHFAILSAAA